MRGDGGPHIAVGSVGARLPPRAPGIRIDLERVGQRDIRIVGGAVVEVQVIETGRVFEAMREPYGIRRLPRILELHLQCEIAHSAIKTDKLSLREHLNCNSHDALRDRSPSKDSPCRNGRVFIHIRSADTAYPESFVPRDERDGRSRHTMFFEYRYDLSFELCDALGPIGMLLCEGFGTGEKCGCIE